VYQSKSLHVFLDTDVLVVNYLFSVFRFD
jgi:hypothetical protein